MSGCRRWRGEAGVFFLVPAPGRHYLELGSETVTVEQGISLELLQHMIQRCLDQQTAVRQENAEMRSLMLSLVDQGRRTERRLEELRDDLELMLKAELMGRLGHFETGMEAQ